MGLFGGGSSKSSSNATQVGSQTQVGTPISISQAGKGYKGITIKNTDHDAVGKSFGLAEDSLELGYWLTGKVLDSSTGILARNDAAAQRLFDDSRAASRDILAGADKASARIFDLDKFALSKSFDLSRDIISAGEQSAGAVERVANSLQSFVNDQNNPNENNQMLLIAGGLGLLAVVVMARR